MLDDGGGLNLFIQQHKTRLPRPGEIRSISSLSLATKGVLRKTTRLSNTQNKTGMTRKGKHKGRPRHGCCCCEANDAAPTTADLHRTVRGKGEHKGVNACASVAGRWPGQPDGGTPRWRAIIACSQPPTAHTRTPPLCPPYPHPVNTGDMGRAPPPPPVPSLVIPALVCRFPSRPPLVRVCVRGAVRVALKI